MSDENLNSSSSSISPPGPQSSASKRSRSIVHDYFELQNGRLHCKIENCNSSFTVNPSKTTSGQKNHLMTKHKELFSDLTGTSSSTSTQIEKFSQDGLIEKLMKFIVLDNQAFTLTECEPFKDLLQFCNPEVELPSGKTVRRELNKMYTKEEAEIAAEFAELDSKVSFILDCWTSRNQHPFQGVITVYADRNWNVQTKILDLSILKGSHTGENLADSFMNVLTTFDLTKKLMSITTDNASNMDTLFSELQKLLQKEEIIFDSSNYRVRCLAHIINLSCQDAIAYLDSAFEDDRQPEVSDDSDDEDEAKGKGKGEKNLTLIRKVRKGVKKVRSSPQRREVFYQQCIAAKINPLELILDTNTRWNSTYKMLERALIMKEPLNCTLRNDKKLHRYVVEEEGWARIKSIVDFLKPFLDMTVEISKAGGANISICQMIWKHLLTHLERFTQVSKKRNSRQDPESHTNSILQVGAKKAMEKLLKYYNSIDSEVYVIATVLDPRFKLQWFRDVKMKDDAVQKYQKVIENVWNRDYKKTPEESSPSQSSSLTSVLFASQMKKRKAEDELEKFLSDPPVQYSDLAGSVLSWWKQRQSDYPQLSLMAKDYLPVSGSGVPVERLFSNGPDLLTNRRCSLSAETVQELFCVRGWIQSKQNDITQKCTEAIVSKILGE